MVLKCGIILLDDSEIIFRIYQITHYEWKLNHYHSAPLTYQILDVNEILEIIGDFFTAKYVQHVTAWKICSRQYPKKVVTDIAQNLSIDVENLGMIREQELLCKGMLTEIC
jgi:hypothetical protein